MNNSKIFKVLMLSVFCIAVILPIGGCKKFGIPDYKITVVFDNQGILGTPAEGENVYEDLESVAYEYSTVDSNYSVEVFVNGDARTSKGEIRMYTDISVNVKLFDIRGEWDLQINDPAQAPIENFNITIVGDDLVSGTFTDDQGRSGTWQKNDEYYVLTYSTWANSQNLILSAQRAVSGSFKSVLVGSWEGGGIFGFWDAVRIE